MLQLSRVVSKLQSIKMFSKYRRVQRTSRRHDRNDEIHSNIRTHRGPQSLSYTNAFGVSNRRSVLIKTRYLNWPLLNSVHHYNSYCQCYKTTSRCKFIAYTDIVWKSDHGTAYTRPLKFDILFSVAFEFYGRIIRIFFLFFVLFWITKTYRPLSPRKSKIPRLPLKYASFFFFL